jgi:trk system potassium uptake protein
VVVRQERLKDALRLVGIREEPLRRAIIIGAGQAGSALARALDERRVNVKIIDRDAERCARLAETLDRVLVIKGDGSDKALLEEENVSDADFVIAITGEEDTNVLISLLCKKLGAKRTITRVSKSSYVPILSEIGIDSVVSSRLSAVQAILRYIRRGKIVSVVPLKGEFAEAIEAEALETSDIVNTPLSRVKFPKGAIVGALVRGEEVIIPRGDTIVQPKDRLIIFALQRVVPKIEKLLTVKLEYF